MTDANKACRRFLRRVLPDDKISTNRCALGSSVFLPVIIYLFDIIITYCCKYTSVHFKYIVYVL